MFSGLKKTAGKRPFSGAAAEVEETVRAGQTREGSFCFDIERSAASDPRDSGAQALRRDSGAQALRRDLGAQALRCRGEIMIVFSFAL